MTPDLRNTSIVPSFDGDWAKMARVEVQQPRDITVSEDAMSFYVK